MDRYRDRNDSGQRHREHGDNRPWDDEQRHHASGYDAQNHSSNFRDGGGQRWESAGGHRADNRDWRRERDDDRYGRDHEQGPAYGVGADAAYGAPGNRYYGDRPARQMAPRRDERPYEREREIYAPDPHPGYREPVNGQTTEGGFFTPGLDGPPRDGLTGAELRRYQQGFDPDYVSWRDEQLNAHDRDYHAWREEQRRSYDNDYSSWRRERQDKFGKDFSEWRTQRTASSPASGSGAEQRRATLSASRPGDVEKPKKHES